MKKPSKKDRKALAGVYAYLGIAPLQLDAAKRSKDKRKRQQMRHQRAVS